MPLTVQVGTILTDDQPRRVKPYSGNWNIVKVLESFALDRKIHAAGWSFFFMAAEVKVAFFGALGAKKLQNAVKRILVKVKAPKPQQPRRYWNRC